MNKMQLLVMAIALGLLGCESPPAEPASTHPTESNKLLTTSNEALKEVTAVQFRIRNPSDAQVMAESTQLLSVLLQQPVGSGAAIVDSRSIPDVTDEGAAIQSRLVDLRHALYPGAHVRYSSRSDTVDAWNTAVRSTHTDQETDVGEVKARLIARSIFEALVSGGLVSSAHLDFDEAAVRERTEGQSRSDGTEFKSWVSEYRFFTPLRVNGIPVSQRPLTLGLLIVVRRSGEIVRVRIDAVGVASAEADSYVVGGTAAVALQAADAEAEASAGFVNPVVESVGIHYIFPPGGNAVADVPRRVYRVHEKFLTSAGVTGRTKAITLSYRVDAQAPLRETFPTATPAGRTPDTK